MRTRTTTYAFLFNLLFLSISMALMVSASEDDAGLMYLIPLSLLVLTVALGAVLILLRKRLGLLLTMILMGAFLLLGIGLFVARIWFTIENGGMEAPDGYGSPMAFMIGLCFEQSLFTILPLAVFRLAFKDWKEMSVRSDGTNYES